MIELDGAFGEGGGQILRSSLALSLLTGKSFHLANVRARRARPGLQPQHLMSVQAAAQVGSAEVDGASLRCTDLVFRPGTVRAGKYHFPIGTAGATGLVLQTVYLPLSLGVSEPSELILEGGTHVEASPCFHFLDTTWRAYMKAIGLNITLQQKRPGFYPRGGGRVEVAVQPCSRVKELIVVERVPLGEVTGFSAVAGLPDPIAERQTRQARKRLESTGLDVRIRQERWEGGPGTVLALVLGSEPAPTLFFGLGARGKSAEKVADEAVEQACQFLGESQSAVDSHSADQIVLPLAFAPGSSRYTVTKVTSHLQTNIAVIQRFLNREIICRGSAGKPGEVEIK